MITVEGLTKSFGPVRAVDGISFELAEGEALALIGPSGCGKSTTLRMINRLIEPSAGRVLIDGVDTTGIPPATLRLRMGYAIQGIGLFPHRTVAQNIATVPRLLGWPRPRIAARVAELLELFGLPPAIFARKYPHELSGGQQQRVGVARAMAGKPAVLLMDEPFGALDPITRTRLQDEFLAIRRRMGTTVLLVTHDMDEAFKLADRLAVMERGRIVQLDAPESLLRRPASAFVESLIGSEDRGLKLLSLAGVTALMGPAMDWMPIGDGTFRKAGANVSLAPLSASASLREAASRLVFAGVDELPVIDEAGAIVGVIDMERIIAFGGGSR
ncbi:ABC transporter ATP-binding protein [Chelatococcus daeguensis]|uniref:ABC transporter n=1 Tax=Chelatococcus daeguensis TaxID=444444 RepID=A0AAC9JNI8_9HYPH|nr:MULTISPECIES: ABC transporter ATP-binding protein [Chelatococcus]APF37167.1 ABC transporter [Chelatococcus daeguensis]KZE35687.1 ABC transporter [Chelatococcus daeguensis]MBM3084972.1 ABC transporter ATP-binding protein [Chelatococcus daeguensis]